MNSHADLDLKAHKLLAFECNMLRMCASDHSQKPTMYTGGRLHMSSILVQAGEGVVGAGRKGVAGV